MDLVIILIISIVLLLFGALAFDFNMKKVKEFEKNKELDKVANKYPENIDMCKQYLKMLKNKDVKIENDENVKSSLYIAISNKIVIANIKDSYTRIQTIAHECLHSVQSRKLLLVNFWFSNLYILYFTVICVLAIFNRLHNELLFVAILILLSMMYCLIRNYLENDAMTKSRFLAEKYMIKQKISTDEEIEKMVNEFEKLNELGIKSTNFYLYVTTMVKIIIFSIICLII